MFICLNLHKTLKKMICIENPLNDDPWFAVQLSLMSLF